MSETIATPKTERGLSERSEEKIKDYLKKTLEGEARITEEMNPDCEVSLVIPVYSERESIFRPLSSLAKQTGVERDQFEVIFVINNPSQPPIRAQAETEDVYKALVAGYEKAVSENQTVLSFIQYLNGGELLECTEAEKIQLDRIKASGVRIHVVDKTSPGQAFAREVAHVGSARNRGVAEAVARFYGLKKNGIVAQSDADTRFPSDYIFKILGVFRKDPDLIGIGGTHVPEIVDTGDALFEQTAFIASIASTFTTLVLLKEEGFTARAQAGSPMFFAGSNMASRAFETALVGGVPTIEAGEDTRFGLKLGEIGKTRKAKEIVTYPADRASDRTIGAGMQRENARKGLEERKMFTLMRPEYIRFLHGLSRLFIEGYEVGRSPQELHSLFVYEGRDLLSDHEWNLFWTGFEKDRRQFSGKISFDMNLHKLEILGIIDRKGPTQLPLAESVESLIQGLRQDSAVNEVYLSEIEQLLAKEEEGVTRRRQYIAELVADWFSQGASSMERDEKIDLYVTKYTAKIERVLGPMTEEDRLIQAKIFCIVADSTSSETALRNLERTFPRKLQPITVDELQMARAKLGAMYNAVISVHRLAKDT